METTPPAAPRASDRAILPRAADRGGPAGHSETMVAEPAWVRALVWIGFPLPGAGSGWLLKAVTGWVVSLPWAPLQGAFELADQIIASIGEPQATIVALAGGALAGLVLAFIVGQERIAVTVSGDRVGMARGEYSRGIEREVLGVVVRTRMMRHTKPGAEGER